MLGDLGFFGVFLVFEINSFKKTASTRALFWKTHWYWCLAYIFQLNSAGFLKHLWRCFTKRKTKRSKLYSSPKMSCLHYRKEARLSCLFRISWSRISTRWDFHSTFSRGHCCKIISSVQFKTCILLSSVTQCR